MSALANREAVQVKWHDEIHREKPVLAKQSK
jgi:hypothetical protein